LLKIDLSRPARSIRLAAGATQAALASRRGISQPAVAGVEAAGSATSVQTLANVADALGMTLLLYVCRGRSVEAELEGSDAGR
jgi:transcriptional regulator with XRE-family HTH domain